MRFVKGEIVTEFSYAPLASLASVHKKVGRFEYRIQITPACGRQGVRNLPYPLDQESI